MVGGGLTPPVPFHIYGTEFAFTVLEWPIGVLVSFWPDFLERAHVNLNGRSILRYDRTLPGSVE
jgi:hypothetical protein